MKPKRGYWGEYGGMFVSELLIPVLNELENAFNEQKDNRDFNHTLNELLVTYAGRPTPLTFCEHLSNRYNSKIYLKREDLLHSGAHKINNALGQALLARTMGKKRLIAETGAGQHGVATAIAAAKLGLECDIYMGAKDIDRQSLNVFRMELCGARVIAVNSGSKTLKDAVNAALKDYTANSASTHYLLGSALGPHPYPTIVAHFHSVIGTETREQILNYEGELPSVIIACVGGGSNAIGIFRPFIQDEAVQLIGVEAAGNGLASGHHAARLAHGSGGSVGVLHGSKSFLLQDSYGQIQETTSISPGLDYPMVGPEHAYLFETGRVQYYAATDMESLGALQLLCKEEGILPALESAHALAWLNKMNCKEKLIVVNLSGRGDKDINQILQHSASDTKTHFNIKS